MQTQSIDGNINSPERSKERDYLLATSPPPGVSNAVPSSNEETRREKLRKFLILSSLFIAYLLISAAYSILSPFYPQEVSVKLANVLQQWCLLFIIIWSKQTGRKIWTRSFGGRIGDGYLPPVCGYTVTYIGILCKYWQCI